MKPIPDYRCSVTKEQPRRTRSYADIARETPSASEVWRKSPAPAKGENDAGREDKTKHVERSDKADGNSTANDSEE